MNATTVLEILILGALMGMLGQGARAIIGLKTMTDYANAQGVSASDLFVASRLITSLLIGILVGLASALVYDIGGGSGTDVTWHVLVGWAAAAYAGTDALEGFISQYLSPGASQPRSQLLLARLPLSAKAIVLNAFAMLHKPNVTVNDSLTKPPIGFQNDTDYDGLLDKINSPAER